MVWIADSRLQAVVPFFNLMNNIESFSSGAIRTKARIKDQASSLSLPPDEFGRVDERICK